MTVMLEKRQVSIIQSAIAQVTSKIIVSDTH